MRYVVNTSSNRVTHDVGEPGQLYPEHQRPSVSLSLSEILGSTNDKGPLLAFISFTEALHAELIEIDPDYYFLHDLTSGEIVVNLNADAAKFLRAASTVLAYRVYEGPHESE